MTKQREPDKAEETYRYLHLSAEELAQLPADERLLACLEMRRLLDMVMGVLYSPDSTLILRGDHRPALYRGRTPLAAAGSR